jgi:hypothetical protein
MTPSFLRWSSAPLLAAAERARFVAPALLLLGCTTPDTLKSQPPTIVLDTPTKMSVIRDCIFDRNKAISSAPYGENGWQLALEPHGGDFAEFYVLLVPNALGGTHVEARIAKMPWRSATFEEAVSPCIEHLPAFPGR